MKSNVSFAVLVVLTFVAVATFSPLSGHAQEAPKKGDAPRQPTEPEELKPVLNPGAAAGATGEVGSAMNYMDLMAQVDAAIQRMDALAVDAKALSVSFGNLASLHEGADRSEILMMQRMSDSMGMMAGETKVSLQQYKNLLNDETANESGQVKAEVQGLKSVMDGIVREIEQGLQTLHAMQAQLGQG